MLSARKKVANIYMVQPQGQILAGKQYGYVMVQNIIQKLIINPQLVGLLLLLRRNHQYQSVVEGFLCRLYALKTLLDRLSFLQMLLSVIADK